MFIIFISENPIPEMNLITIGKSENMAHTKSRHVDLVDDLVAFHNAMERDAKATPDMKRREDYVGPLITAEKKRVRMEWANIQRVMVSNINARWIGAPIGRFQVT